MVKYNIKNRRAIEETQRPTIAHILPAFRLLKDDWVYKSGFSASMTFALFDKTNAIILQDIPTTPYMQQNTIETIPKTRTAVEFGKLILEYGDC